VNIEVTNLGVLSNSLPFTILASTLPAPTNISISQTGATAGAAAFLLTVNGTNLLPCSVVQWTNGSATTQLATTYVSPTQTSPAQLIATVPAADIVSVGTAQIAVATPASSTNTSAAIAFPITLATMTSIVASTSTATPPANNAPYCSPSGLTLTVNGTGFANGLVVNWNGSPRPTTLVNATQLTAAISAADTASLATKVAITVSGSGPGTNSNSLPLILTALPAGITLPAPSLNSISPASAAVEALTGPPVALTVNGSNLSPCSAVQWNGAPLPATVFIGTGGIASFIPAANITATGNYQVSVATPGATTSGNDQFTVYTPGSPSATNLPGASLSLSLMSFSQRYSVFVMASPDGVTPETPGTTQNVFVNDSCKGVVSGCTPTKTLVSAGSTAAPGNADSILPSINADSAPMSPDGRYVAFLSSATNLAAGATNGFMQAFLRDTCAGASSGCTPSTQLVSVSTGGSGVQGNGATTSATIDSTGRYVTFESSATNLGANPSKPSAIYVHDTCTGAPSGCVPSTFALN